MSLTASLATTFPEFLSMMTHLSLHSEANLAAASFSKIALASAAAEKGWSKSCVLTMNLRMRRAESRTRAVASSSPMSFFFCSKTGRPTSSGSKPPPYWSMEPSIIMR